MKLLYLIRHAKSSWEDQSLSDFDRPLNKRGEKDAPFMGRELKKLEVRPHLIIASPAKRAYQTAVIIAKELHYPEKEIIQDRRVYHAGIADLLSVIRETDNRFDSVFLFGHNPGLTDLANYLSDATIDNIPTCGIFCIEFDTSYWQDIEKNGGRFKLFDYPKKYKR